jgi:F-type H+-transporting ATPase subunit b
MISINATLLLQVIHFLVLMFILNRLMLRPILKVMHDRSAHTERTKHTALELEQKLEALKVELQKREEDARKRAAEERSKIRSTGMGEAQVVLGESQKEVASIRASAEAEADHEATRTKPFLRDEAAALVDVIIERVIGRKVAE